MVENLVEGDEDDHGETIREKNEKKKWNKRERREIKSEDATKQETKNDSGVGEE